MVARAAYDALDAPLAVWRGILPDGSGINNILYAAYYGRPPEKWFSPFKPFGAKNPKYTLATYYFCVQSRLYGSRIPFPEFVPAEQAVVVARWAARGGQAPRQERGFNNGEPRLADFARRSGKRHRSHGRGVLRRRRTGLARQGPWHRKIRRAPGAAIRHERSRAYRERLPAGVGLHRCPPGEGFVRDHPVAVSYHDAAHQRAQDHAQRRDGRSRHDRGSGMRMPWASSVSPRIYAESAASRN